MACVPMFCDISGDISKQTRTAISGPPCICCFLGRDASAVREGNRPHLSDNGGADRVCVLCLYFCEPISVNERIMCHGNKFIVDSICT